MSETFIGLDKSTCAYTCTQLNILLSSVLVAYLQAWSNHWNVVGPFHNDYHVGVFGKHVDELKEATDLLAERISNLEGVPDPNPAIIARNTIRPYSAYTDARGMLEADLALEKDIAKLMREVYYECDKNGDVGTANLLADLVQQGEFRMQRLWHLLQKDMTMTKG